ncbi:MAG: TIGR01777 family oxidoreductase [Candidatus Omnitrophota bacterium]
MEKIIVITGVSGFIGKALGQHLINRGYLVKGLTRGRQQAERLKHMQIQPILWDAETLSGWEKELEGVHAIINLSGESIGSGRWTDQKKSEILNSRVHVGMLLMQALRRLQLKPNLLVQASAIGFYGNRGDTELDEQSTPGTGFLAETVKHWEASTDLSVDIKETTRRVIGRFGLVLGKGGILNEMAKPFRFFVGGKIGSGKQWMSWIHITDLIRAIAFLIEQKESNGVYNFTSPHPVRNIEFAHTLGKALSRPSVFPLPGALLKLFLGEKADELLLTSQDVIPRRLLESGFSFQYPQLEPTLNDIYH